MNTISGENDQAPSVSGMRELFERWLISVGQDERQASRDYSAHDLFVAGALAMLPADQREAFKAEQQRVNFWASYRRIRAIRSQYPSYNPKKALSNMLDIIMRLPPDYLDGQALDNTSQTGSDAPLGSTHPLPLDIIKANK